MSGSLGKPLRVTDDVVIEPQEFSWRFSRASGPGGQGVNTTDSRVELCWNLAGSRALSDYLKSRVRGRLQGRLRNDEIVVVAAEHRSQRQNRQAALDRLARLLAAALAPPSRARRATRPTRSSARRRLDAKTRRAKIKGNRRRPGPQD